MNANHPDYVSWLGNNAVLFNPLTPDEQREHDYLYWERIGILCGSDKPTPEQEAIARVEANSWLRESRLRDICNG